MSDKPQRRISLSTAAIAVIVVGMLAASLGYYIGARQSEGTYTIRGDSGSPILGGQVAGPPVGDSATAEVPPQDDGRVNVNTATMEELQVLPGIGPALAQRIVDFRERYGAFTSAEDLTHVSGIGEVRLEQLRDLITW
ncbi:MAG: ComEA family DNA-binding protein [Oscillospiraceae bacterium]|nr:ComEA family DNA-binding protein [Oscillospiraceae bacterium]